MPKTPESDDLEIAVTATAMRQFAEAIHKIADKHSEIAGWMEREEIAKISPKNFKTAAQFLVHISSFIGNCTSECSRSLSVEGVSGIEGGMAVLRLYLERTSAGLLKDGLKPKGLTPEQAYEKHKGRRKPKKPPKSPDSEA